jgi:lipoprotein LpqH
MFPKKQSDVQRALLSGVAGAALIATTVAACANTPRSTSSIGPSSNASATTTTTSGPVVEPFVKVTIDGQVKDVGAQPTCVTSGSNVYISMGTQDNPIKATLTTADPPEVASVSLGEVDGQKLSYNYWLNRGDADATKTGNSIKITGTASSMDASVSKPFEIDLACSASAG